MSNRQKPKMKLPMSREPDLNNGGRWHHIASDEELKEAVAKKDHELEVPAIQMRFICASKVLTIVRVGIFDSDLITIEGGWVYDDQIQFLLDWKEIYDLAHMPILRRV